MDRYVTNCARLQERAAHLYALARRACDEGRHEDAIAFQEEARLRWVGMFSLLTALSNPYTIWL